MEIKEINSSNFSKYGKVIKNHRIDDVISVMNNIDIPDDVIYIPSLCELEKAIDLNYFKNNIFGGLDIQVGHCSGHNTKLNALEYHRTSEINIAITDIILILGKQQDIDYNGKYETSKAEIFFVPKNTIIELYATTLHFAPCHTSSEGFHCIVILPKGTNTQKPEIHKYSLEDYMLFANNKWLIAHKDYAETDMFVGLRGQNIDCSHIITSNM